MRRGFLYLVAVMDWATRRVLSWRLSNTIAKRSHGVMSAKPTRMLSSASRLWKRRWHGSDRPEIFNSDQGSQFTSPRLIEVLTQAGVRVAMDGRGRWMDDVFIERLWRSLKYECLYLHAFETGSELRAGLLRWIGYHNRRRPHSSLGGLTADEAYAAIGAGEKETEQLAA